MNESEVRATAELSALAEAHGVSASYWSFFGERVEVPSETLRLMLSALGVPSSTPEEVRNSLAETRTAPWRSLLPPSLISRPGEHEILAHVRDGHDVALSVIFEDGSTKALTIPPQQPAHRAVDGCAVWRVVTPLPDDLPLGWHTLRAVESRDGAKTREADAVLGIVPERLPHPPARPGRNGRSWGLMAQLYSVRSTRSWGLGDLADLADLAAIGAGQGADFVLVNPLHAGSTVSPIEPSPYLPSSRYFRSPLYARPEHILDFASLVEQERAAVLRSRESVESANGENALLDRDSVWRAKREALRIVFGAERTPARQAEFAAYTAREGKLLDRFALWCALDEHYGELGEPRPVESRNLDSPLVAALREPLSERIDFFRWVQWILDEQTARAQAVALVAGMRIGIMHDLAVGVDPEGFDANALESHYLPGLSVGAPPDMYNPRGQNWSQPPWHPRALAETGYEPLRRMLRGVLRHAGAVRIDHIAGLFRLWCIPAGIGLNEGADGGSADAASGAYLRYDHEAMLGVVALEAARAGATVIGEDLGTVEPMVRSELAARGILGTSVLWFERDLERDGNLPLPPEQYRTDVLASVSTHDLFPAASRLTGAHLIEADALGLLAEPLDDALAGAARERAQLLDLLRRNGLIEGGTAGEAAAPDLTVEAMHRLLALTPARLIGVSLADAVGERRAQNIPGTHREYPNWQVPLADISGKVVRLDELTAHDGFRALAAALSPPPHQPPM